MVGAKVKTLKTSDWFHQDGFPIAVEPRSPQLPFGMHNHEFCEIVVITNGHGLHLTGSESWPIVAGDAFVITGDRPHIYKNMEDLGLLNVLYQPDLLRLDIKDLTMLPGYYALFKRVSNEFRSRMHLTPNDLQIAVSLIERLKAELQTRDAGFQFVATAIFMEIVGFLSRCYHQNSHKDSQSLLRIAQVISHLETNFTAPIEIEHLAQIAQMSKRSFMRAFKKTTGMSAISYLIRVRISKSVDLLQQEGLTISKVSSLVGYDDSNYFCRQFNNIMGLSPTAYRRQISAIHSRFTAQS